ncbi:MAG: ATP-binding protein, partial [Candidatus Sulfotelmatobacter sp.]
MQLEALLNPFPGLRPFEADEDHLFFGREKEIDDLLQRLRSNRFLTVAGTSGSGKSSLVRSGLIPALQSGFMVKAGSSWRVATFRPGENPIGHLAASLDAPDVFGTTGELATTNRVLLEATLRRSSLGLVAAVRQAVLPRSENVLVVVDQFEELFRFRRSAEIKNSDDEAVAFVSLLLEAAQQNEMPIYVVLTMRSDFIGDCIEFAGLPEAVNEGLYLVPRMTRDELRSAITGPVAVAGGEIAPRLLPRLLNEVAIDHDQLPVLQHALMRTWDHWRQHHLPGDSMDIADYEAVGTLSQALSLHADEAYAEADSEQKCRIVERMFKALTDTFTDHRGVRRPSSVQELSAICEVPEAELIEVIEIFRKPGRSFLMPPVTVALASGSIIDLSHESLMRCWSRLIHWADEERASAGVYARLSQAALWFAEGSAGLWRDPELALGLKWKVRNQPTKAWAERYNRDFDRAMDFLDRSAEERERIESDRERQRKRKLARARLAAGVLAILLCAALLLAYFAWNERSRAEANLRLAMHAVDESLSSAGREQGRESSDSPQLEQFRRELLEKAGAFYSGYLAKQEENDPGFQEQAARLHSKLGDINRLLERPEDAVAQYKEAIGALEKLHQNHPQDAAYRQGLGYAYNWLGETLRSWAGETPNRASKRSDAESAYNSALRLQQELHSEFPQSAQYQQELARTYYNRGILRYDDGNRSATESDFRDAIQLLEPLLEKKTVSQSDDSADPPSHDAARAYNDL